MYEVFLPGVPHPIRENISSEGQTPVDGAHVYAVIVKKANMWLLITFL